MRVLECVNVAGVSKLGDRYTEAVPFSRYQRALHAHGRSQDDENKTLEKLDSLRMRKAKFLCVNDDMVSTQTSCGMI